MNRKEIHAKGARRTGCTGRNPPPPRGISNLVRAGLRARENLICRLPKRYQRSVVEGLVETLVADPRSLTVAGAAQELNQL